MKMICLCGISGCGKTTWAKEFLKLNPDYAYFNPDEYYAKFNGSELIRDNTFEVWHAMFRDIHTAGQNGKNVLIDSDNLTVHQRMQWIEWFPEFEHILIYFYEDFKTCYDRVQKRKRKLSYNQLLSKFHNFELPSLYYKDGINWKIFQGGCDNVAQLSEAIKG